MESLQGMRRGPLPDTTPRRPIRGGPRTLVPAGGRGAETPDRELEAVLVRRLVAGEEVAFELFSDLYIPVMYRFVQRSLAGDPELTREIVQTTLAKVIPKLATFRGDSALTTWLSSCCRNEIAAHFRRAGRRPREVNLGDEVVASEAARKKPAGDGPERSLLRREKAGLVHEALDRLPAHYGQALEWKYLENLPVREIGRRLELSPKAAESLLTRARGAFREVFSRLVPAAGNELNPETAVEP